MLSSDKNHPWIWGLAGIGALVGARFLLNQWRKTDFRGQTVVITGGSRGLGLVMARQFAREGAKLAICARNEAELATAKADLDAYNVPVYTYVCDVTQKAEVEQFIQAVRADLGPIDVLVNNAGIIIGTPLDNATEEDFREAMDTNFWACFWTVEAVLPDMRRRQAGRIVNIASFGGKIAVPHLLPYSVSKFSLVGYSEGLRAELKKDGIYVTTVCPGLMRTGSPRNAIVKGQVEKEYAWFKIADSLPFLSVSAEQAAEEIVEACRYGKAELILTLPARIGVVLQGIIPGVTSDFLAVVNGLLPSPGDDSELRVKGKEAETPLSHSALTTLTDEAAVNNNQFSS